jgi:MFS family permease
LGIMSGVYFYTYTAMQIPSGILLDKFSPRYVITGAILICTIGAALFAFSNSLLMGCLARLFMGIGSAFAFVSVLVVTADLFESKYFATLTGITQALAALGAMSGQLPVSLLVDQIGWRHTILLLTVIGGALIIITWITLRYHRVATHLNSEAPIGAASFKQVIGSSQTWLIALYACLLWAPMSGFASLWGVPFLQAYDNLDKTTAALLCSMMWLGIAFASPLLGYYSTKISNRVKPLWLSSFVGVIAFALLLTVHLPNAAIGSLIFIAGAACAGQALSFTVVKENNSYFNRATAIGFNNMAVVISGAIFQPLIGALIDIFSARGFVSALAYQYALLTLLAAYVVGTVIAAFYIRESFGK